MSLSVRHLEVLLMPWRCADLPVPTALQAPAVTVPFSTQPSPFPNSVYGPLRLGTGAGKHSASFCAAYDLMG